MVKELIEQFWPVFLGWFATHKPPHDTFFRERQPPKDGTKAWFFSPYTDHYKLSVFLP